jgi:hypothetical protein
MPRPPRWLVAWPLGVLVAALAVLGLRPRGQGGVVVAARWGWSMAGTLSALLSRPRPLPLSGLPPLGSAGEIVLTAHLAGWEDAAIALAGTGRSVLALAAPWHRSPHAAAAMRDLRARGGVRTVPRGMAGWREAVRHVAGGGTLVALVDSLSPRGRRAVPFVNGPVGAPDALVALARRRGALLLVAAPDADGWAARVLPVDTDVNTLADEVVRTLRDAASSRPWDWAWVRALALVCVVLGGCVAPSDPVVTALPWGQPGGLDGWEAEARGLRWTGTAPTLGDGVLSAQSASVRWEDGGPVGIFGELHWEGGGITLTAPEGEGRWPQGPFQLRDARLVAGDGPPTTVPLLGWGGDGGLRCGGCVLEGLGAAP